MFHRTSETPHCHIYPCYLICCLEVIKLKKRSKKIPFAVKFFSAFISLCLMMSGAVYAEKNTPNVSNETQTDLGLTCKSAVLMEASSGKVLYAKNADEALPPASVTKVMTLLLVMEAIDGGKLAYTDTVIASANAASMGGSQIFLKEGESMTVEDLLKSVVIASANDAAVALAEHIAGSEGAFVARMNERARELGLRSTHFENTNGLDDTVTNHVTSAYDIAVMSRELISHRKILEYSSIWMDTIRNGSFGLTNTNRLVRFYKGATGLKTGSTSKAKFCISATACRDGMDLICVIMAADSRDIRNDEAKRLLDWGYANYELFRYEGEKFDNLKVVGGVSSSAEAESGGFSCVVKKGEKGKINKTVHLSNELAAPLSRGDVIGKIEFSVEGGGLGEVDIVCKTDVEKISFLQLWLRMLRGFFLK